TIEVLGLILLLSPGVVFAEGPQMFQYGWDGAGGLLEGEIFNTGASLCVSSIPNPYPDPKISVRAPTTGCQNGSHLSPQDTAITIADPQDGEVYMPGNASATATSAELTATATVSTAADEAVAVVSVGAVYYQENLPSPVPPGHMLTRVLKV